MSLIGQASQLDCMLVFGYWNNAPSCARREMSQRLTRVPSNCGKSKLAWRSAGICHISNLKLSMKNLFFFLKQKPFFSSKIWNCWHKKIFFSHDKTFFSKIETFLKNLFFWKSRVDCLFLFYSHFNGWGVLFRSTC